MLKLNHIAIAPNAFKGTLTALQAAICIRRGLARALPKTLFTLIPIADGGDGTAAAIVAATKGRLITSTVRNPLGRNIRAQWGLSHNTAIIESSAASGLALLNPHQRNPLKTSTFGTGQLITAALDHHAQTLIIGIGGSATNDAGLGMAQALGARLFNHHNQQFPTPFTGASLSQLAHIDLTHLDPRLRTCEILVACDVTNPLAGTRGAACIYAPQKGATPIMVRQLDAGLRNFAAIVRKDLGQNILHTPGAGAAGGLGAALLALLGAQLRPGVDLVMDAVHLRSQLTHCDLVITGEGRFDAQTAFGKAPAGVARLAHSLGIPTIALCGSIASPQTAPLRLPPGIIAAFSALEEPIPESALPRRAPPMLQRAAEQLGRVLALFTR